MGLEKGRAGGTGRAGEIRPGFAQVRLELGSGASMGFDGGGRNEPEPCIKSAPGLGLVAGIQGMCFRDISKVPKWGIWKEGKVGNSSTDLSQTVGVFESKQNTYFK